MARDEEERYAILRAKRQQIVCIFQSLRVPALEHSFLRTLILSLGLVENCVEPPFQVSGIIDIRCTVDALFYPVADGVRLRQAVLETCSADHLDILAEK